MTDAEVERVAKLADTPMAELRMLAFDQSDTQPSKKEARERFDGFSRGDLIRHILYSEE